MRDLRQLIINFDLDISDNGLKMIKAHAYIDIRLNSLMILLIY